MQGQVEAQHCQDGLVQLHAASPSQHRRGLHSSKAAPDSAERLRTWHKEQPDEHVSPGLAAEASTSRTGRGRRAWSLMSKKSRMGRAELAGKPGSCRQSTGSRPSERMPSAQPISPGQRWLQTPPAESHGTHASTVQRAACCSQVSGGAGRRSAAPDCAASQGSVQ